MRAPGAGAALVRARWWWAKVARALVQLAAGVMLVQLKAQTPEATSRIAHLVQYALDVFVVAPWSFLLLAAGASSMLESMAMLWGIAMPRSYNRPFGRRNISEFWAHWNMTATRVFRDLFFYNKWGMKRANAYVNTMAIFVACGAWHAANPYWVLWGTLHGLFFCAFLKMKSSAFAKTSIGKSLLAGTPGIAITYVVVCLCWYLPSKIIALVGL
jgi:alginate O-acetyltransferase complex protein AlgI